MKCNCKTKCNPCRAGAAEGERRKADALALLEARREVYVRRARRALLLAMLDGDGTATADDVREMVELPEAIGPKCFGAAPGPLARAGIIRADGFAKTGRPTAHARPVTVWVLVDRAKAERWLDTHPELLDPAGDDQGAAARQGTLFDLPQETATPTVVPVGAGMES